MKKLTLAAAAVAFAGTAQAADLYVKAPVVAVYDWSGIYVGANAGGGWADATWGVAPGLLQPGVIPSFTTHPTGALAGGQIGINKQYGNWVWGAEVTGDWANLRESLTGPLGVTVVGFGPFSTADVWTTKLHDLETLTSRFGYAVNNWLFYAKSGGATGVVNVTAVAGQFPLNPPNPVGATFSQSQRLWGGTVGAGIEYGLTPNWVLGVEYDFTRLFPGQFNGFAVKGNSSSPVSFGAATPFDVQSVLGRVSYKF
jgi:outer membrane immunogenic protein